MAKSNPNIPTVDITEQDPISGLVTEGTSNGVPPVVAGVFSLECEITDIDGSGVYQNTGTVAIPAWTLIGTVASLANGKIFVGNASNVGTAVTPSGDVTITNAGVTAIGGLKVSGANLKTGKGYFSVAVGTNGTTPVNVFGAGGAPIGLVVTSVVAQSLDTTAGNIILKNDGTTVSTIAKGTAAGVCVAEVGTLATGVYSAAAACTVESSSAGNARVVITFTIA
jgi:hypothetical protein